ncbi:MAG: hypothetical protein Q8N51_05780 [Gammaproteobacteria bacterium]|nr:hypothetical protein [Gammaproteobacteria bacterium]
MTNTELLAIFRGEVSDLEAPYLWSDSSVYGYIDEAQKQFCRDTYGIEDARTHKVTVVADTEWYSLSPKVLKVRNAVDSATGASIPLVAAERMAGLGMRFDGRAGPLRALITGLEKGQLRAWPVPNVASVAQLHTFRLPADMEAGDDFEVDDQHVRNLLYWVKYRAYSVQDSETYDKRMAERSQDAHAAYCARAKDEQSRLMHTASCVAYGGI